MITNQNGCDFEINKNDFKYKLADKIDGSSSKKQGDNVQLKILVPSISAGAIIGKGGEAIAQIQKETSTKVKMSKAMDCYPGTTERVCIIVGSVDSVTTVHNYIMDRIFEKPDPVLAAKPSSGDGSSQARPNVMLERHKQVKILVPNSTAGMIIGKGGSFIKEIKDQSGSFVQISQKSKEMNLPERCVIIAGELAQNRIAVSLVLKKIAEDPQSGSCSNISYNEITSPVASVFPTGSPYAVTNNLSVNHSLNNVPFNGSPNNLQTDISDPMTLPPANQDSLSSPIHVSGPSAQALNSSPIVNIPSNPMSLPTSSTQGTIWSMDSLRDVLRNSGFNSQATEEIANAIHVLSSYGFLNISALTMVKQATGLTSPPQRPTVSLLSPNHGFSLPQSAHMFPLISEEPGILDGLLSPPLTTVTSIPGTAAQTPGFPVDNSGSGGGLLKSQPHLFNKADGFYSPDFGDPYKLYSPISSAAWDSSPTAADLCQSGAGIVKRVVNLPPEFYSSNKTELMEIQSSTQTNIQVLHDTPSGGMVSILGTDSNVSKAITYLKRHYSISYIESSYPPVTGSVW